MKKEKKYNTNIFKILRLCNDLQIPDLANKIGITQQYVRDIEKGNRYPSDKGLEKYCDVFEISVEKFRYFEQIVEKADDNSLNSYQKVLFFILTKLVKL